MASVTGNGGNFPHFKPPKKPGNFPVFYNIFIESKGVTSFRSGNFPVFRLTVKAAPALSLGL